MVIQGICQNPNATSTQPNLTKVVFDMKITVYHPTTKETQYQEYLSYYWPDFDETLKVASWNHL